MLRSPLLHQLQRSGQIAFNGIGLSALVFLPRQDKERTNLLAMASNLKERERERKIKNEPVEELKIEVGHRSSYILVIIRGT